MEETLLAALDQIARELVANCAPLQLGLAQSSSEREAVYRLRYQEVIERGWAKPTDYPDGLERDEDDDQAAQIALWDGETLAGTARLIFPTLDHPLPVEKSFGIAIEPEHEVVYLSRVLIAPSYRGKGQHRLLLGILGIGWIEVRDRGFRHICGVFADAVMPTFASVGIKLAPLGAPQEYLGETRFLCFIDMLQTAQALMKKQG